LSPAQSAAFGHWAAGHGRLCQIAILVSRMFPGSVTLADLDAQAVSISADGMFADAKGRSLKDDAARGALFYRSRGLGHAGSEVGVG